MRGNWAEKGRHKQILSGLPASVKCAPRQSPAPTTTVFFNLSLTHIREKETERGGWGGDNGSAYKPISDVSTCASSPSLSVQFAGLFGP